MVALASLALEIPEVALQEASELAFDALDQVLINRCRQVRILERRYGRR